MKSYEMLYILNSSMSDEEKNNLVEKINSMIEKVGGKIGNVDKWGDKKFAYPINYKNEGYYCLVNFEADVNSVKPLSDLLNITENVIRHMIVSK